MDENDTSVLFAFYLSDRETSMALFIINLIFGLPTNICVLWLIATAPGDKASEIFSLNLSICEIAICVSSVMSLIPINNLAHYLWGINRFFSGFIFTGRPLFMSCICIEWYLAVVHPTIFLRYKPLRYKVAGTGISWLIVLASCIFSTLVLNLTLTYVSLSMVITSLAMQLFCSAETLRALSRPSPGEGNREGMNSMKVKAFKIIVIIMVSACVTYVPFLISVSLFSVLPLEEAFKSLFITSCISVVAGFVQPLLYIHRAGKLPCIRAP